MKQQVQQLAVFGGSPLFEQPRHVGQPHLPDSEAVLRRIQAVLDSGWLTNNGPQVQAFEAAVSSALQVRNCVAVCNGTMALQIMARACGLTGEVIVPAMTFIATAHALEWIGLTPVFADVDPVTHTLDPRSVAAAISSRTSAILGVHVWGNPCDVDSLQRIADAHKLWLLFDASHAAGCRLQGRSLGTFGDAEAFSFHATKIVNALEGGAIVTDSDELADRCRLLRNFGITGLTDIQDVGINGKMSEISAATGLESLADLPIRIAANRRNAEAYQTALRDCPGLRILRGTADDAGNAQYIVASVDSDFGLSRDQLVTVLRAEGVFVRSYFMPGCHRAAPYRSQPRHCPVPLPVTEQLLQQLMQFPTGGAVDGTQIQAIADVIRFVAQRAGEVRSRLTASAAALWTHSQDPGQQEPMRREAA